MPCRIRGHQKLLTKECGISGLDDGMRKKDRPHAWNLPNLEDRDVCFIVILDKNDSQINEIHEPTAPHKLWRTRM